MEDRITWSITFVKMQQGTLLVNNVPFGWYIKPESCYDWFAWTKDSSTICESIDECNAWLENMYKLSKGEANPVVREDDSVDLYLERIDDMLESGNYVWAVNTLEGIRGWVAENRCYTEKQETAVTNIEDSRRDGGCR